jgi:hypothetical protein
MVPGAKEARMAMRTVLIVAAGALACGFLAGCASPAYVTPFGYLGLADDDEYPEGVARLVPEVAAAGYYAVTKAEDTSYGEFLAARREGIVRYEAEAGGRTIYYSIATHVDLAPAPNVREWVLILERKKTVRP